MQALPPARRRSGARVGDADLLTLALHFQGRALVKEGVRKGLVLLDEAMVAVVTGEVWPPVTGHVYCSMIDACQETSDLRRAHEWTAVLAALVGQSARHGDLHRPVPGPPGRDDAAAWAWPEAVEETKRACERLAHAADKYTTGAAMYRQAELYRARAVSDIPAASDAAAELTDIADEYDTPALRAVAAQSMGAVLLANRDAKSGLASLRRAWDMAGFGCAV